MKKLINISLLSAILIFAVGCNEDFLEKEPSQILTTAQLQDAASRNPDIVKGTVTGIYGTMVETGTGGTTGHDDFGHKAYDLFSDFLSSDMALSVSTYGWYRASITEMKCTEDFTYTDNYQVWRHYYRIVRSANSVIAQLGGNDFTPELDENKYLMGQAKAMRAHSYFYLAQYFQKSYNASEEILPLYDDLEDLNGPKVTAGEIYTLIENDLNDAITLLDGYSRPAKNEVNQDIAKAILAYVYGAMGRDSEAKVLAAEVINTGAYTLMNSDEVLGGFNNLATSGWMWGVDLNADTDLDLVSWWGQVDYFSYSYAGYGDAKAIDQGLFDAIPANDVRKGQFSTAGGYTYLMPLNKFYDENRVVRGNSTTVYADYVFMRIAEMYLLHAETAARSGDEGAARTSLKTLLSQRVDDVSYVDGLSGQALLDEIYLQTRIELWGEGKSYLAMKRNKATIVRGSNHLSFVGEPIRYDDERLTFEIPESEIQNNPFVSDQNL